MNIGMVGWSKVVGFAGVVAISLGLSPSVAAQEPPSGEAPAGPVIAQQPAAQMATSPEDIAPSLATLDRMDATNRFGAQVGFFKLDRLAIDDAIFARVDLYGQYMLPDQKIGIYGQLPISRSFLSDSLGESTTAVGNLDVGVYGLPTGSNELILRAGVMLSTATEGTNGLIANSITAYGRMTDLPLAIPNMTVLRLSASTVQQRDAFFFRGDLGLDLVLDQSGSSDQQFFGRANVAGGVRLPAADVSLEVATYGVLDGDEPTLADRFLHTGALAVRSRGTNQVHAAFIMPLDDAQRGELWIFSLGYQRAM